MNFELFRTLWNGNKNGLSAKSTLAHYGRGLLRGENPELTDTEVVDLAIYMKRWVKEQGCTEQSLKDTATLIVKNYNEFYSEHVAMNIIDLCIIRYALEELAQKGHKVEEALLVTNQFCTEITIIVMFDKKIMGDIFAYGDVEEIQDDKEDYDSFWWRLNERECTLPRTIMDYFVSQYISNLKTPDGFKAHLKGCDYCRDCVKSAREMKAEYEREYGE